jgi:transcriptional regulator with XRE-family HTH domain
MKTVVAKLRCKLNVSQKELAAALGVHRVHLGQVELGTRKSVSLTERAIAFLQKTRCNALHKAHC